MRRRGKIASCSRRATTASFRSTSSPNAPSLDEEIGPVPVALGGEARSPRFVWMEHRDAVFDDRISDIRVGGAVIPVIEGTLRVPA
jgi:hypothetical protein